MSGIVDRRAKRFISTEQAERAVPSRPVMASRVARDDVNPVSYTHLETQGDKQENKADNNLSDAVFNFTPADSGIEMMDANLSLIHI